MLFAFSPTIPTAAVPAKPVQTDAPGVLSVAAPDVSTAAPKLHVDSMCVFDSSSLSTMLLVAPLLKPVLILLAAEISSFVFSFVSNDDDAFGFYLPLRAECNPNSQLYYASSTCKPCHEKSVSSASGFLKRVEDYSHAAKKNLRRARGSTSMSKGYAKNGGNGQPDDDDENGKKGKCKATRYQKSEHI